MLRDIQKTATRQTSVTEDAGKKTFRNQSAHWININHLKVMSICSFVIFAEKQGAINK